jgi:hypothetical protein
VYGQEVVDFMMAKPAAAIATLIAILASFAYLLMRPSKEVRLRSCFLPGFWPKGH